MAQLSRRAAAAGALRRLAGLLAPVTLAALAPSAPASDADSWLTYNKDYSGERYSSLRQINRTNVARLRPVCVTEVGEQGAFQTGLLVVAGTIYLTTQHTTLAVDARSCRLRWRHIYRALDTEINPSNRGVAYDRGRVYRGTADGRVLAIDARSGRELWRIKAGDSTHGEFFSSAPIAWEGRLYIGTSGGDWGGSSRMMAFDVATGRELWRFNLIPQDGEAGADTWKLAPGGTRRGGATWSSYALDTSSGELFIPTGNPAPALDPSVREGDDLYTDSIVVLDARSGRLRWYYQLLRNDALDFDLAAAPVLYRSAGGIALVAAAGKDGHLYGVDRTRHQLAFRVPVTTVENERATPTVAGIHVCPGVHGGVLWNGPAFDPRLQTLFVGAVDQCMVYRRQEHPDPLAPTQGFGTAATAGSTEEPATGWVTAVDAATGAARWRYHAAAPVVSGITATAGDLVFAGTTDGDFVALDARRGTALRKFNVGGLLGGGIVTYEAGGAQYVAFVAGGSLRAPFMRHAGLNRLFVATLTSAERAPVLVRVEPYDEVRAAQSGPTLAADSHAHRTYLQLCALCHGPNGDGIDAPRLRGVVARTDARPVVEVIKHPGPGMPAYYPDVLNDADVTALAAFIEAWK